MSNLKQETEGELEWDLQNLSPSPISDLYTQAYHADMNSAETPRHNDKEQKFIDIVWKTKPRF